jgi:hypothetical protein
MIVSLDGKPLASSRHYLVKMVSRAENTDQTLERAASGAPGRFHLKRWGGAPIRTLGRSHTNALRLLRRKQPILSLALVNGTWELLVREGRATLVCDTAGIHGTLFGNSFTTRASAPIIVEARPSTAIQESQRQNPSRFHQDKRSDRAASRYKTIARRNPNGPPDPAMVSVSKNCTLRTKSIDAPGFGESIDTEASIFQARRNYRLGKPILRKENAVTN